MRNQALEIIALKEQNASLKECNASLEEQLQIRNNLPVIEMGEESGQQNCNEQDENDKVCLILPKDKYTWFKQIDEWKTVFAVFLLVLAIGSIWLLSKPIYTTEREMETIDRYNEKRTDQWKEQLDYLGLQEDKINEMQDKLETSKINVTDIETRITALLNKFEHEDAELKLIEEKIPSENDLQLISKQSLEEHLYELENNEPKLINYTVEFHSVHDTINVLAGEIQWTINTEREVGLKLKNHYEMLDAGNTTLDHLDSAQCQFSVKFLQNRLAKLHETLANVVRSYRSISNMTDKVAMTGNTYRRYYQNVKDDYYMSMVRVHLALMETEVCFPRLNHLHKYTLVMYGIDKRCVTKVLRHLRKSQLVIGSDGKDSWLFINSKPVLKVRKGGLPEYLVPVRVN